MRNVSSVLLTVGAFLAATVQSVAPAHAGLIVGGSALLNNGDVASLEGWLGEGPLVLTNIFTKAPGNNAGDFHAAADGQGRTFSVIEAFDQNSGVRVIIGGYNPQSWNSSEGYHITIPDSEHTAFLFNLTAGTVHRQLLNGQGLFGNEGIYQTYNIGIWGPVFGGGGFPHDIWTDYTLTGGLTYVNSYANPDLTNYHRSLLTNSIAAYDHTIGGLEVFKIGPQSTEPVPEPSMIALLAMALMSLLGVSSLRSRATT